MVAIEEESRHARLVAGHWPRTTGQAGLVETALTDVFAARLAVRPGDELRVQPNDGPEFRMRVAGLYRTAEARPSGRT